MLTRPSLAVRFEGTRSGEWGLSWGQLSMWRTVRWVEEDDPYFNVRWTLPIGRPHRLADVVRAVRMMVERHEALRTTYVETPQGTVQHLWGSGVLQLTVVESDRGESDPAQHAEQVAAELAATAFQYDRELPLRCAVVREGGRPLALALAVSHLAVDAWSLRVLAQEWRSLLSGTPIPAAEQPVDRGMFEYEEDGQARGERSLRYLRRALLGSPRSLFDYPPSVPEQPRFVRVAMESQALAVAAEWLASRWRVTTTSVIMTTAAALLATLTGHDQCPILPIVSNRHDARFQATVGPVAQDGFLLLALDPVATFAETIRRGHAQAILAYRSAHYDPAGRDAVEAQVGRDRGVVFDLSVFANDIRESGRWDGLPPVSGVAGLRELVSSSRELYVGSWDKVDAKVFLTIGAAADAGRLDLAVDTAFLSRETAYRLLRGVEAVLVRSVADRDMRIDELAATAGLTPIQRPPGWVQLGADWVSKEAVAEVVRQVSGSGRVAVEVEPSNRGGLTAYVAGDTTLTPDLLHDATLSALAGRTDAVAPQYYVVCARAPEADGIESWRACPRLAEGTGRGTNAGSTVGSAS